MLRVGRERAAQGLIWRGFVGRDISRSISFKAARGMHDLLPDQWCVRNDIIEKGRKVAERYGFQTVDTPVVEHEELFTRSLGQQSEIVQKELFSWAHQEEQQTPETSAAPKRLSLRPEGTAGIVRAFFKPAPVSDHLKETAKNLPEKVFYSGQMFRRERPQKGRYRQFTQLGVEWISQHEHNIEVDTEMLSMAHTFLSELGVPFRLTINSLGSTESQRRFVSDLSDFLSSNLDKIEWTAEERQTLETSIQSKRLMRLLDWAHSKKGPIGEKLDKLFQLDLCPKLVAPDFLSSPSSPSRFSLSDSDLHRFKELLERLQALGIPFEINPYLVRGLDYYSQTIWECVGDSPDLGSQQNTILAGGRYDSLVKQCSGSDKTEGMSGIGWAAGVDRLALIVPLPPNPTRCVYVAAHHSLWDDLAADQLRQVIFKSLSLVHQLRASGFKVIHQLSPSQKTKLSRQLQTAESHNTFATIIVAPSELKQDQLLIKNMDNASQTLVPFHKDSVLPFLSSIQTQTKTSNA